jgi:tungstate transport system substrate-binding protein
MRRLLFLLLAAAACGGDPQAGRERVVLVTTTTVEGSGLLDALVTAYHASQDDYRLATTAVGSGAALEIGRRGDADILLTHDSAGEARFMAEGFGRDQGPVMRNEFVVAGPAADPAGVRGAADLAEALRRVAASGSPFVSRSDDSGTHRRELQLWDRSGRSPRSEPAAWYVEAGAGMDEALRIADQRDAYILTDRSTFRHLSGRLRLVALARGQPPEANPYRYTIPRETRSPEGARSFRDWLVGPGQTVIARYGVDQLGEPLFTPTARAAP